MHMYRYYESQCTVLYTVLCIVLGCSGACVWSVATQRCSHEGDSSAGLVDLPHIQSLILVQTLLKLVWSVALGQNTLPSLVKPDKQEREDHL